MFVGAFTAVEHFPALAPEECAYELVVVVWAGESGEPVAVVVEKLGAEVGSNDVEERSGECHVVGVGVHFA